MNIERFDNEHALAAALATRLIEAISLTPRIVLGLPTGRTPVALYREVRSRSQRGHVDWSQVRTFNLDEFVGLGAGDAGSYRSYMQAELFDHVRIEPLNIGLLDGRAANLAAECARYEMAIDEAGGIDIQILGIGANGHIGFNEPAESLTAETHVAALAAETRAANAGLFGGDAGRVPTHALSMGMATILHAREIVLMATGAEKADAVAAMIDGPITTRLPASLLQVHSRVTVMLDRAAALRLA
ncbi:MAG: glucosamine-6-phosphate deaminase [Vicinamibacterales bacterium]